MIAIGGTKITILNDGGKYLNVFDMEHMCRMIEAQRNRLNYLRFIKVNATIAAPLWWWMEYKDYHKNKKYKDDDMIFNPNEYQFIFDKPFDYLCFDTPNVESNECLIERLNTLRAWAIKYNDEKSYKALIRELPLSYIRVMSVELDYGNLYRIYKDMKKSNDENWIEFCNWTHDLPYSRLITGE